MVSFQTNDVWSLRDKIKNRLQNWQYIYEDEDEVGQMMVAHCRADLLRTVSY